jgi:hypothetical protein
MPRFSFSLLFFVLGYLGSSCRAEEPAFDLVIYGGTSGGVAAAVQGARMNKSVVLIEPGNRLGGLTTGGLGQTDIGNKQAIGGIAREFYARIAQLCRSWSVDVAETRGVSRLWPNSDGGRRSDDVDV